MQQLPKSAPVANKGPRQAQNFIAGAFSFALTAGIFAAFVSLLSPQGNGMKYGAYAVGATILMIPLFIYLSKRTEVSRYGVGDWMKATGIAVLLIGGSAALDVIFGHFSHPDLPLLLSAFGTVGIWPTIFVSPIVLATIYCTFRQILLSLFGNSDEMA